MNMDPKALVEFHGFLDLRTLLAVTYLIPIAITLRKLYAPTFDTPGFITCALARIDDRRPTRNRG